jgi:hypothetical protein
VFNKLFCQDELVHMGRIVERICRRPSGGVELDSCFPLEQLVGIDELKHHESDCSAQSISDLESGKKKYKL